MRTPKDMAVDALASEAEHTRRATALRRLASGVRAQSVGALGLNEKERKTLTDAVGLLDKMTDVSSQAAALAKRRSAERAARERAIRSATKTSFASLTSVEDQVALIYAVNAQVLTTTVPHADKLRRLREEFNDALDGLVQSLASKSGDKRPEVLVVEAWARFEASKASAQANHSGLIDALNKPGPGL
jgi:hypothetical protein